MSVKSVPYQPLLSIEEASAHVFNLLRRQIPINTFFIATNDGHTVDVVKAMNQEYMLLEEGFTIDFQESY